MRKRLAKIGAFVAVASMALTGLAQEASSFFEPGRIAVGCNYWASHAGIYMWRNWNPAQVEKDLDLLAAHGMTVLRVFPLWPDFQPLTLDQGWAGKHMGYLQNDGPLLNYAAVDTNMMSRFAFLCDAAQKRGLKLIVGLVTGWMSNRLFVPVALERENVLTSPTAIMWQVRFVRYFVEMFKGHPAIVCWDFGNECDCMGEADSSQMWNWFHAVGSEIRLTDSSRKLISGLSFASTQDSYRVNLRQQGELTDIVTTHPYPLWSDNCNLERFDSLRNACHAPCETALYSDLTGKIGIVEEAGSLGPGLASDEVSAATMRMQLFGCWATGVPLYLWWCGFDQNNLSYSPYERTAVERELGLFSADGKAKCTALELRKFVSFQKSLPFVALPKRRIDAVVLVSRIENAWRSAQGAWMLSRQAGFDIHYASAEDPIPDSDFYILPSGEELDAYSRTAWRRLCDRIREGATALITLGNAAVLSELKAVAGVSIESCYQKQRHVVAEALGQRMEFSEKRTRDLKLEGANALILEKDGAPLVTEHNYGKGKVVFVNAAIEMNAPYAAWPIYALAAQKAGICRLVSCLSHSISVTEHPQKDGSSVIVAINHERMKQNVPIVVDGVIEAIYRGNINGNMLSIEACDAAVFEVNRKDECK